MGSLHTVLESATGKGVYSIRTLWYPSRLPPFIEKKVFFRLPRHGEGFHSPPANKLRVSDCSASRCLPQAAAMTVELRYFLRVEKLSPLMFP